MSIILGMDIGGSAIKYGWGNHEGLQHFDAISLKQKTMEHFRSAASQVLEIADRALGLDNVAAVGIGSPGTIERSTSRIRGVNPNLPFWTDCVPADIIPENLKIPVFVDNDANLMALAEAHHYRTDHALGITVGSGIGGGIILNGSIYHGANGFGGEFGHVTVVDNGQLCNCGKKGCLEAYASVDGLRRSLSAMDDELASLSIGKLLERQDNRVTETLKLGHDYLVAAIVNYVTLLDPEYVILGGGGMDAGMYDVHSIKGDMERSLAAVNRDKVAVVKAFYGNRAGVMGAILLASRGIMQTWE